MLQKLAQCLLKFIGWKIVGALPQLNKYVLIVAPHTSNWDLPLGLLGRTALAARIEFLAKHQIFFFPLGWLLQKIGGIPVERSHHHNLVDNVVAMYEQREQFILGLAPEGTRSPVKRWKQGFYHIACMAKIPIVMVGLDYPSKEIRIMPPFYPKGDIEQDFAEMLIFFKTIKGCHPKEIPDFKLNP